MFRKLAPRVVSCLLGLTLVGGLIGLVSPPAEAATSKPVVTKVSSSATYTVPGWAPGLKVSITKPVFSKGAKAAVRKVFNDKINALVNKEIAAARKTTTQMGPEQPYAVPGKLWIKTPGASVYKNRYVSVAIGITYDAPASAGSCHDHFVTYTYDSKAKKFVSRTTFADTNHKQLFWAVTSKAINAHPEGYPPYPEDTGDTTWGNGVGFWWDAGYIDSLPSGWTVSSSGITFWSQSGELGGACVVGQTHYTIPWSQVLAPGGNKGKATTHKKLKTWYMSDYGGKQSAVTVKGKQVKVTNVGLGGTFWGVRGTGKTTRVWKSWTEPNEYGSDVTRAISAKVTFASKSAKAKPTKVVIELWVN